MNEPRMIKRLPIKRLLLEHCKNKLEHLMLEKARFSEAMTIKGVQSRDFPVHEYTLLLYANSPRAE